ncbi:hypothetical protein QQ020_25210 [Fulvivirgaceae bacterium BMA12]|uniref:Uncharacterized protein n=1 Tax=Agaribacillus aureus TaxID=3051825 RepID=A0ABT8LGJ2_9BACT|nr:hypothetical protein [Fulvivirgaceae bacterium BMA12]
MKNKLFLILVIASIVGGGGFYAYKYFGNIYKVDTWTLVPNSAVMVYESSNTVKVWNALQKKAPWKNLLSIPFFRDLKENFESLDSLGGRSGQLDELFRGNPFLISMHITGDDTFDYVYYIELKDLKSNDLANRILGLFKEKKGHVFSQRKYKDFDVNEIRDVDSKGSFTYVNYKNFFIGSFTPHLVEDAIRNITGENLETFENQNAALFNFSKLDNDDGNLYVNSEKISELYGTFASQKGWNQLRFFSEQAFLDVTLTDKTLLLNGFSQVEKEANTTFLGTFKGQKPGKMQIQSYLPNRTAILFHLTFENAAAWKENLVRFWRKRVPNQMQKWEDLGNKHQFDVDAFFSWLGYEIGLATLESVNANEPEKILIINALDVNEGLKQLNKSTELLAGSEQDTLYIENYSGQEIRQIPIQNFPGLLLGPQFNGFKSCFYTVMDSYLVMANNVQVLKNLINDRELENVWSKSLRQTGFMESILEEANVSLIVNTLSVWNILQANLNPKWQRFSKKNAHQLRQFENISAQFSYVDNKFFTSLSMDFVEKKPTDNQPQNYMLVQNAFTETPIATKPFVVRNHVTNRREVLLQDQQHYLYLIGADGKTLWRDSIGAAIQGGITQIDYYGNGKLQYYFITDDALHVIDRLGNYVENFPIRVQSGLSLYQTSVVDYDKSKKYRFLVADKEGNIYMFDKRGKNLDGWQPRRLGNRLATPPFHIRVRGRDCIVAVQEDGVVNMLNRRGQMYPGFPFDLKDKINNPLFVNVGTSFKKSFFTSVTNSGLLVRFNFDGAIFERKQLLRPTKDATFKLAIDALGRTYIIARQEQNRVSVLDRNGEEIFEKDYAASGEMAVQYYDFGRGQRVYALTDQQQEFTYLYDADGKLINYQPIESGFNIGLMYFESRKSFRVFKNYENNFSILDYKR